MRNVTTRMLLALAASGVAVGCLPTARVDNTGPTNPTQRPIIRVPHQGKRERERRMRQMAKATQRT